MNCSASATVGVPPCARARAEMMKRKAASKMFFICSPAKIMHDGSEDLQTARRQFIARKLGLLPPRPCNRPRVACGCLRSRAVLPAAGRSHRARDRNDKTLEASNPGRDKAEVAAPWISAGPLRAPLLKFALRDHPQPPRAGTRERRLYAKRRNHRS